MGVLGLSLYASVRDVEGHPGRSPRSNPHRLPGHGAAAQGRITRNAFRLWRYVHLQRLEAGTAACAPILEVSTAS